MVQGSVEINMILQWAYWYAWVFKETRQLLTTFLKELEIGLKIWDFIYLTRISD